MNLYTDERQQEIVNKFRNLLMEADNFPRENKMKGMGQIVTWSVRDETLHCNSMIRLFRAFIKENPEIWNEKLKNELYDACKTIVAHEDSFIDLAFQMGPIQGLTADQVKNLIAKGKHS